MTNCAAAACADDFELQFESEELEFFDRFPAASIKSVVDLSQDDDEKDPHSLRLDDVMDTDLAVLDLDDVDYHDVTPLCSGSCLNDCGFCFSADSGSEIDPYSNSESMSAATNALASDDDGDVDDDNHHDDDGADSGDHGSRGYVELDAGSEFGPAVRRLPYKRKYAMLRRRSAGRELNRKRARVLRTDDMVTALASRCCKNRCLAQGTIRQIEHWRKIYWDDLTSEADRSHFLAQHATGPGRLKFDSHKADGSLPLLLCLPGTARFLHISRAKLHSVRSQFPANFGLQPSAVVPLYLARRMVGRRSNPRIRANIVAFLGSHVDNLCQESFTAGKKLLPYTVKFKTLHEVYNNTWCEQDRSLTCSSSYFGSIRRDRFPGIIKSKTTNQGICPTCLSLAASLLQAFDSRASKDAAERDRQAHIEEHRSERQALDVLWGKARDAPQLLHFVIVDYSAALTLPELSPFPKVLLFSVP